MRRALPVLLLRSRGVQPPGAAVLPRKRPRPRADARRHHRQPPDRDAGERPRPPIHHRPAAPVRYDVRVQETDARRPDIGLTARVVNIIARQGRSRIAMRSAWCRTMTRRRKRPAPLMTGSAWRLAGGGPRAGRAPGSPAHPDGARHRRRGTGPHGRGRRWSTDRDVMSRLNAYINVEAIGSSGRAMLFETGPGNGWIVGPWAHRRRGRAARPSPWRSTSACRTTPTSRSSSGTTCRG